MNETADILLVEDNETDIELFTIAAKKLGWIGEIHIARNGKQGLVCLHRLLEEISLPDLILVDLNMPHMDGFEFLEKIGKTEELCSVPALVLTTSSQPQDVVDSYNRNALGFLVKPSEPFQFQEMFKKLHSVWEKTRTKHSEELKSSIVEELRDLRQVGRALVSFRQASGISQSEMARRIGVPAAKLECWEQNSYAGADMELIHKALRALKIHVRVSFSV